MIAPFAPEPISVGGGRLIIEIDKNQISLLIECQNRYAAIELYDRVVAMAHAGRLQLDVTLGPQDEP